MVENKRVALITGASNGMGYEAARLFASRGWIVFAGARRVEKIPKDTGITAVRLDVTNTTSNKAFVKQAIDVAGRIDVLVNNAGYGEYGPAEEIPMDNVRYQFEVNFFGAVELTQLVMPIMREQHYGRIVNISSIGGNVYTPLGAYYHATKAALQQWSDVLDMEVAPFGVRSIIVQPGGTRSDWGEIAFENARKNLKAGSPYGLMVEGVAKTFKKMSIRATSGDLAQVFYRAATDSKPQLRYFNSLGDRLMVRLAKAHPKVWKLAVGAIARKVAK